MYKDNATLKKNLTNKKEEKQGRGKVINALMHQRKQRLFFLSDTHDER